MSSLTYRAAQGDFAIDAWFIHAYRVLGIDLGDNQDHMEKKVVLAIHQDLNITRIEHAFGYQALHLSLPVESLKIGQRNVLEGVQRILLIIMTVCKLAHEVYDSLDEDDDEDDEETVGRATMKMLQTTMQSIVHTIHKGSKTIAKSYARSGTLPKFSNIRFHWIHWKTQAEGVFRKCGLHKVLTDELWAIEHPQDDEMVLGMLQEAIAIQGEGYYTGTNWLFAEDGNSSGEHQQTGHVAWKCLVAYYESEDMLEGLLFVQSFLLDNLKYSNNIDFEVFIRCFLSIMFSTKRLLKIAEKSGKAERLDSFRRDWPTVLTDKLRNSRIAETVRKLTSSQKKNVATTVSAIREELMRDEKVDEFQSLINAGKIHLNEKQGKSDQKGNKEKGNQKKAQGKQADEHNNSSGPKVDLKAGANTLFQLVQSKLDPDALKTLTAELQNVGSPKGKGNKRAYNGKNGGQSSKRRRREATEEKKKSSTKEVSFVETSDDDSFLQGKLADEKSIAQATAMINALCNSPSPGLKQVVDSKSTTKKPKKKKPSKSKKRNKSAKTSGKK